MCSRRRFLSCWLRRARLVGSSRACSFARIRRCRVTTFPDLERAAESVGERRFPLDVDDMLKLCKRHGLSLRWFDRKPLLARDNDREVRSMLRSFFESPRTVYLNRSLKSDPARLKFDLASHLGAQRVAWWRWVEVGARDGR